MVRLAGFPLALLLITAIGCDFGTYDRRAAERLDVLKQQSQLAGYLRSDQWTQLPDANGQVSGVLVRHPAIFDDRTPEGGGKGATPYGPGDVRDFPNRAKLPGIDLPGFAFSYEQFTQNSQQAFLSFHCYHWLIPADAMTHDELLAQIEEKVQTAMPDLRLRWEKDVEFPSPTGTTVKWSRMKLLAGQVFAVYPNQNAEVIERPMDGHLMICVHTTSRYHVVMGWRAPTEVAGELKFLESAEACMSTIKQNNAPANSQGGTT